MRNGVCAKRWFTMFETDRSSFMKLIYKILKLLVLQESLWLCIIIIGHLKYLCRAMMYICCNFCCPLGSNWLHLLHCDKNLPSASNCLTGYSPTGHQQQFKPIAGNRFLADGQCLCWSLLALQNRPQMVKVHRLRPHQVISLLIPFDVISHSSFREAHLPRNTLK